MTWAAIGLTAQAGAPTDLVQVSVHVPAASRPLGRDWRAGDFQLFEDGQPRQIVAFQSVQLPTDIALITAPWAGIPFGQFITEAGVSFRKVLHNLPPEDTVRVVRAEDCLGYSAVPGQRPDFVLGHILPPRVRPAPLPKSLTCAGEIFRARNENGRVKAVLILGYTLSGAKPEWAGALQSLLDRDIAVYLCLIPSRPRQFTMGIGGPVGSRSSTVQYGIPAYTLEEVLTSVGGQVATFKTGQRVLEKIFSEIQAAVVLAYRPSDLAGWHDIKVQIAPGAFTTPEEPPVVLPA